MSRISLLLLLPGRLWLCAVPNDPDTSPPATDFGSGSAFYVTNRSTFFLFFAGLPLVPGDARLLRVLRFSNSSFASSSARMRSLTLHSLPFCGRPSFDLRCALP